MTKTRKHTETWLVIGTRTMTLMDSEPTVHGCLAKILCMFVEEQVVATVEAVVYQFPVPVPYTYHTYRQTLLW